MKIESAGDDLQRTKALVAPSRPETSAQDSMDTHAFLKPNRLISDSLKRWIE